MHSNWLYLLLWAKSSTQKKPSKGCARCLSITQITDETGLDIKPLQGRDGFRIRFGGFRAIYEFENEQLMVLVLDAGSRGGIYK